MNSNKYVSISPFEQELMHKNNALLVLHSLTPKTFPSNTQIHWHDYFEIEIFLDGTAEYIYNQTKYSVKRGDAFLINLNDIHSISITDKITILNIRFNNDFLNSVITDYISLNSSKFYTHFNEEEISEILSLAESFKQEEKNANIFYKIMLSNIVENIVMMIIRHCSTNQTAENIPSTVQNVVSHINYHYNQTLSLNECARKFSIAPDYLGKLFKKNIGISFNEYLNQTRINQACKLLMATDMSVNEIAVESGYTSTEHFIYTFKKHLGTTPSKYRKSRTLYDNYF